MSETRTQSVKKLQTDVGTLFFNLKEWDGRPFPPSKQEASFIDQKKVALDKAIPILAKGDGPVESGIRRVWAEFNDQWTALLGTLDAAAASGNASWWHIGRLDGCKQKAENLLGCVRALH